MSDVKKIGSAGIPLNIVDANGRKIMGDAYDNTAIYSVGDYCINGDHAYKCIIEIETPEDFNTNHWQQITIEEILKEHDASIESVNASLTNNVNLKKWTLKTNSAMVVNDQLDISDAGKNILIGTNLSSPTSLGRGRVVIPNIDGASYYVASSNGTAIHFRIEISNNKLTLLAITTGYKIEAVYI